MVWEISWPNYILKDKETDLTVRVKLEQHAQVTNTAPASLYEWYLILEFSLVFVMPVSHLK